MRLPIRRAGASIGMALFFIGAWFGSTAAQAPTPQGVVCPGLYQPVCGRKARKNETYPNVCEATADKASVIAEGRCPEICTELYQPVCGIGDDGRRRDYSNRCLAVVAGARVVSEGPCGPR